MFSKISKYLIIVIFCLSLPGCAALSAIKAFAGGGDSKDSSTHVEANLAARDNKKAIISHETSATYSNRGNVTQNGVKFKESSLGSIIWSSNMSGIDVLITLLIVGILSLLALCAILRFELISKKIKLKMLAFKNKK